MITRAGKAAKGLLALWLRSWLFVLWSALCICLGAAWAFAIIIATLKAQGIL